MKICEKHWSRFKRDLPKRVLPMLTFELADVLYNDETIGEQYEYDYKKLEQATGVYDGCPICLIGDSLYSKTLERVKKKYHLK